MSEAQEDYARFKADYPAVYDRLLEINRALSKLQRAQGTTARRQADGSAGGLDPSEFVGLELD